MEFPKLRSEKKQPDLGWLLLVYFAILLFILLSFKLLTWSVMKSAIHDSVKSECLKGPL